MTELAKMTITPEAASNFAPIEVLFNPNTYSISKSISWPEATGNSQAVGQTERRKNAPARQFGEATVGRFPLNCFSIRPKRPTTPRRTSATSRT